MSKASTRLKPDGQAARLLRWLRDHPGASSLEITRDLFIVNVTGRVSDLRAAGYTVECRKGPDKRDRYFVIERTPVLTGTQLGAFG
jgi:hypothetical protein